MENHRSMLFHSLATRIEEAKEIHSQTLTICEDTEALLAQAQQQIDRSRNYFWSKEVAKEHETPGRI